MQKITPQYAELCKSAYQNYMKEHGIDVKTTQTNCVSFGSKALQEYFINNQIFENSDEIRIFLGVYPLDSPNTYPEAKSGRITTIIWPYKNGKPATYPSTELVNAKEIEPFNIGELMP